MSFLWNVAYMPELAHLEPGERLAVIQKCQSKITKRPPARWATRGLFAMVLIGFGLLNLTAEIGLPIPILLTVNGLYWIAGIFLLAKVRDRVIRQPLEVEIRQFLRREPRYKLLPVCPECGYDQRGTKGINCPECGHTCVGSAYVD